MKPIEKLRIQALASCKWRGHDMKRFLTVKCMSGHTHKISECKKCGAGVRVTAEPEPNDIDVGGEAVAVNCLGSAKLRIEAGNRVRNICGMRLLEVPTE